MFQRCSCAVSQNDGGTFWVIWIQVVTFNVNPLKHPQLKVLTSHERWKKMWYQERRYFGGNTVSIGLQEQSHTLSLQLNCFTFSPERGWDVLGLMWHKINMPAQTSNSAWKWCCSIRSMCHIFIVSVSQSRTKMNSELRDFRTWTSPVQDVHAGFRAATANYFYLLIHFTINMLII